jgi:hypothetical protein
MPARFPGISDRIRSPQPSLESWKPLAHIHRGTLTTLSRSPARVFCLVVGATLVFVGVLGFIAESAFDTGGGVDGEKFIIFEVNGWHNLIHIASGLFLLALMRRHDTACLAALSFGAIYGVVTVIGLIDGEDVLGLFPVNPADNVLHILLTVAAFAAGLAPLRDRTRVSATRTT